MCDSGAGETLIRIKAAINGGTTVSQHSGVPLLPEAIAQETESCAEAGAFAVHFHPRKATGEETLEASAVDAAVAAIRRSVPGFPVGVTTGAWILPRVSDRLRAIGRWSVLPDFASVNTSEHGWIDVAELLLERGIAVEAGLIDANGVEVLLDSGLEPQCLRILIEPQDQEFAAARANVDQMIRALDAGDSRRPRLLHGTGATAWSLLKEAARLGYDGRIGLEDVLIRLDGTPARSNQELVQSAVQFVAAS